MRNRLYFIPMLLRAMDAPDRREGLRTAFAEIQALGREPQYEEGYAQFLRFIEAASGADSPDGSELDGDLARLAEELSRCPELEVDVEDILASLRRTPKAPEAIYALAGPKGPVSCRRRPEHAGTAVFEGLTPGPYVLSHWTGRVLWEGTLGQEMLLQAFAFPEEPLSMAADDGRKKPPRAALEETVLDGAVHMAVYPGAREGRMELEPCQK